MDLTAFDTKKAAEKGAVLQIENPITGEALDGVTITLLGTDSAACKNFQRGLQRDRIAKLVKRRGKKVDFDISEEDEVEALVVLTVGWTGIEIDGKELVFSRENATKLYLDFPWIKEQVDLFVGDRENFLAKP